MEGKLDKKGQEKGAVGYGLRRNSSFFLHCLQVLLLSMPVKAPKNGEQFTKKCTSHTTTTCTRGSPLRSSATLHSHLLEMYSAIK
jgi:hypothetical protein